MLSKCIFESIEELSAYFGTEINLPDNLPEDCNVICFHVSFKGGIKFFQVCKEGKQGFFSLSCNDKWEKSSDSLEDEVRLDKCLSNSRYVYLRLATEDKSDVFIPERLLGVETTLGYITTIINERVVMLSRNNVYWYNLNLLKYYISDDSDETVSFDEYVKLFYDVEGVI